MSFVEWIFLFGGLAVAGPVVAHLLARPRFRRLPFTMLRFLHTGQIESQSRRKLRDLLILLLRCAIIVLIAMLFARPLLHVSRNPQQTRRVHFLGLDNSMSMAYSDGTGNYFDKMVDSAIDYIRSAETGTDAPEFNICALASGDWKQGLTKEQALAEIKALKIKPGSARVNNFLSGLNQAIRTEYVDGSISAAVLSDFTPATLRQFIDVEEPAAVDEVDYEPIVSPKPVNNAAIVDARVVGIADDKLTINAAVINYGEIEQNRSLTAKAGPDKSIPIDINLSASERRTYQLQLDVGAAGREQIFLPVELSLSGGDGLKEDDTFYLAVSIPGQKDMSILLAGESTNEVFLLKTAMDTLSRMSPYDTLKVKQVLIGELAQSDFDWADVIFCSTIADRLGYLASSLEDFIKTGGRFVCFVRKAVAADAARQLWQRRVLAALPGECNSERPYLEPKSCNSRAYDVDNVAARSLANYRLDKILLKGYLECEPHPESTCLWRFQNGSGFAYLKRHGSGASILVNTSVDDSLGSLTKSSAVVAFCRYLLGPSNRIGQHSFALGERVMLPVPDGWNSSAGQRQFWIETCDGKKRRAALTDSFLTVADSAGVGWVKTLGKPTICAGINLPEGETDMTRPVVAEVGKIMSRVFTTGAERDVSTADVLSNTKRRPLWRMFAWAIVLLLVAEPVVASRLKR